MPVGCGSGECPEPALGELAGADMGLRDGVVVVVQDRRVALPMR